MGDTTTLRDPGTPRNTLSRLPRSSSTPSTASAETTLAGLSPRRPRVVFLDTTLDAVTSRPTTAWTSVPPEMTTPTTPASEDSGSDPEDSNLTVSKNKNTLSYQK